MKRIVLCAIVIMLAAACDAHAVDSIVDMAVIDRDSGIALPIHCYRGEYWVAGQPGARYAIEIRNRLGERVLVVTSVDGVNVLSGATATLDQAGYVFGPRERYQITGWRKSDAIVAAFTFTDSANSYAQRTGRPANIGVIGMAIFRERQAQPAITPATIEAGRNGSAAATDTVSGSSTARAGTAPKLGTGHGEREYSYVNYTEFVRLQSQPDQIVSIHYDSFDNLLAMGIVKRPGQSLPNPFPGSAAPQFVPDPPRLMYGELPYRSE